ncbi:von Willebrand factor type A domain protein [Eubacteriaceae bacterium CHKCI004]|nr:von Willebrand factor type A domain protein [Eubacteriaceae bacterium CHKCI004]
MPKWIDLNEMDDDDILLKRNRMSRSLVSDEIPAVKADAYEDDFLDAMEPAKKSMTIFFLIDVSGSMKGTKIGSLNGTMEELLPSLIGVGEASTDVKIAIMKFSTDVEWVTPEPVRIEEYQYWNRLEAEGLTFMGDAFLELSKKLSRSSFLNSPSISFAPVIFLLSDGSPNDDWKKGLETLKQNKWFQHGLKIALGIGSKVNMDVLRAFTGNDELAVQAKNADQLRELIKLLAVTSSQIGSHSLALVDNGGGGQQPGEEVVAMAKQQVLVEEIRSGTKDILGEAVDLEAVDFDEGW